MHRFMLRNAVSASTSSCLFRNSVNLSKVSISPVYTRFVRFNKNLKPLEEKYTRKESSYMVTDVSEIAEDSKDLMAEFVKDEKQVTLKQLEANLEEEQDLARDNERRTNRFLMLLGYTLISTSIFGIATTVYYTNIEQPYERCLDQLHQLFDLPFMLSGVREVDALLDVIVEKDAYLPATQSTRRMTQEAYFQHCKDNVNMPRNPIDNVLFPETYIYHVVQLMNEQDPHRDQRLPYVHAKRIVEAYLDILTITLENEVTPICEANLPKEMLQGAELSKLKGNVLGGFLKSIDSMRGRVEPYIHNIFNYKKTVYVNDPEIDKKALSRAELRNLIARIHMDVLIMSKAQQEQNINKVFKPEGIEAYYKALNPKMPTPQYIASGLPKSIENAIIDLQRQELSLDL